MNTPLVISFKKKINKDDQEEVIKTFLSNLRGTLYKKIYTDKKTKIIIHGEFISFNPLNNVPWNLWMAFAKKAEIFFENKETVIYKLDIKYAAISLLLNSVMFFFIFIVIPLSTKNFSWVFAFILLALICFAILILLLKIYLHKRLFDKSVNLEKRQLGRYNWIEILKAKSDSELNHIADGKSSLPLEVQSLAVNERKRRNNTNENKIS
jgi:hypothetical protein